MLVDLNRFLKVTWPGYVLQNQEQCWNSPCFVFFQANSEPVKHRPVFSDETAKRLAVNVDYKQFSESFFDSHEDMFAAAGCHKYAARC